MTKWARLIDGEAVDVVEIDPSTLFVAEIAEEFIQVPNATVPGSRKSGQQWTHPDPVAPSPLSPPPRRMSVTPIEFMMMFTFAEEAAIRTFASSNDPNAPTVAAMLRHLDDQRLQSINLQAPSIIDGLDALVMLNLLTVERRAEFAMGLEA